MEATTPLQDVRHPIRSAGSLWSWQAGAWSLIGVVLLLCLYRAATLSITYDEALTYHLYIDGDWRLLLDYDPNNHLLHTLLVKLCATTFGPSPLSLRVPAILGGLLYMIAAFRLCRMTVAAGPWLLITVALLTLNPLLVGFFSCARGYSLALAFLMVGVYWCCRCLCESVSERQLRRSCVGASVAFALSLASNLSFAFVLSALGVMFLAIFATSLRGLDGRRRVRRIGTMACFFLPGPVMAALVYAPYVGKMNPVVFVVGHHSWDTSAGDIIESCLLHNESGVPLDGYSQSRIIKDALIPFWALTLAAGGLGVLLLVTVAVMGNRVWNEGLLQTPPAAKGAVFLCGAVCLTVYIYAMWHARTLMPYPGDRTGIYFPPLIIAGVVFAFTARRTPRPILDRLVLFLALLVAARFCLQLNVTHYRTWEFDADSRRIFDLIASMTGRSPPHSVLVGGQATHESSLNYYRKITHASWMRPYEVSRNPSSKYRFFICRRKQYSKLRALGFDIVYEGKLSGASLAVRRSENRVQGSGAGVQGKG